jgi:hypothetical protein
MKSPEKFVRKEDGSIVFQACKDSNDYAERSAALAATPPEAVRPTWKTDGQWRCSNCNCLLIDHEEQKYCPLPAQKVNPVSEWKDAERISDIPDVHEALMNFAEDQTGDNGTCIVRAVMRAVQTSPVQEDEPVAEVTSRFMGIGLVDMHKDVGIGTKLYTHPANDAQEAEPVAITAEFKGLGILTLRLDEMDNELGMRLIPETVIKYYTHPANDKLRQAAEDALIFLEGFFGPSDHHVKNNLRAALEKKP